MYHAFSWNLCCSQPAHSSANEVLRNMAVNRLCAANCRRWETQLLDHWLRLCSSTFSQVIVRGMAIATHIDSLRTEVRIGPSVETMSKSLSGVNRIPLQSHLMHTPVGLRKSAISVLSWPTSPPSRRNDSRVRVSSTVLNHKCRVFVIGQLSEDVIRDRPFPWRHDVRY